MSATLIGVDIGTQGTKAALFDETGVCLATAFEPSQLLHPEPGAVEEDPETQFASVCTTIRRCVKQAKVDPGTIAGIGIDGQMAGVIGVDADGMAITPYDSWLDTRCAPYIRIMRNRAGETVTASTGCPPSINHGPKKLWWKHEQSETYRRIRAFVQPGGYAAMRLCGLTGDEAYIDTTYLHFSGFADNRKAQWNTDLCALFDFEITKLPRIVEPSSLAGNLTPQAARACGLQAGTPVIAGCGDTAASFLACAATREGVSIDVAGTASVFATTTTSFVPDLAHGILGCGRSATPGLWHPYAYVNGGGMNLEWFRKLLTICVGKDQRLPDFDELNHLAEKAIPSETSPLFVPHLGGRVSPGQPALRGAWTDLSWEHGPGHMFRAVLEGVALEYALYRRTLLELYPGFHLGELRVTGGGERSMLWNQIKADALQTPVRRVARAEGAPLGVALLAGYGTGLFRSLPAAAKRWVDLGEQMRPSKAAAPYYAKRLERYETLLRVLDPSMNA